MTKTELSALVAKGLLRESFEFLPDDGTPARAYDVSELRRMVAANEIDFTRQTIPVDMLYPYLSQNRVWEEERVATLNDAEIQDPIFVLVEPDESIIVCDGIHRIIKAHRQGAETVNAILVDEASAPRVSAQWATSPLLDWGNSLHELSRRKHADSQ